MSEIEELASRLEGLLLEEAAFLEEGARRLRLERKALISGETALLEEALGRWQELAEVRRERDRRRTVLLDRLSALTGLRPGEVSISRISGRLTPVVRARLLRAGEKVKTAARRAALEAAVGGELLEEAARFHEGLLRTIGDALHRRGLSAEGPGISLLDARG